MNKLKRVQQKAVGYIRLIFSALLFIISSMNLVGTIKNHETFFIIFIMSIPFMVLSVIMLRITNDKAIILACLIAGLYSAFNQNVIGDYSASIFFIFSFHISRNRKYGLSLIMLSIFSISINAILNESRIAVVVGLFISYTVIYIIYYYFVLKPIENKHNINYSTRSEEEKAILKLYAKGYSYSDISKTLGMNVTDVTIRRKIKSVKDDSKSKNDVQFGQWLFGNA